jgi:uncharacterized protein involved in exopolysaccharide biosynthesis
VLQTLDSYGLSEPAVGSDHGSNVNHYIDIFRRRFFYFLLPFGIVSIVGLYNAATLKPSYLSEGKILLEGQIIAADILRPVIIATSNERIQLIQQRVTTRDTLLSVADKFGLFPQSSGVVEAMRKNLQIKPVREVEAQLKQGISSSTIAFTVGFEYGDPEIATRVANEFVNLIVGEDARSRTSRTTEAVKILTDAANDLESKLASTQIQMQEIAQRPRDDESSGQQKMELAALAALKAELVQKSAVYSDAHPAVIALKKKVVAMEKAIMQPSPFQKQAQSTSDELEALKRQREALEKRLAEAYSKLANARVGENEDQRSERMQVIEPPSLPQQPLKSNRLKLVGMFFAAAAMLGVGAVIGMEQLDGSIRGRQQLANVVPRSLVVCIPYIETRSDIIRARLRVLFGIMCVAVILSAWGGLAAAIVLNLPVNSVVTELTGFAGFGTADR